MACRGKGADDAHPRRGARVGRVDDAERRRAALDQRHRGADILGRGEMSGNAAPHAESSVEHTSELQSLIRISYAGFCLKKKKLNQLSKEATKTVHRTLHPV